MMLFTQSVIVRIPPLLRACSSNISSRSLAKKSSIIRRINHAGGRSSSSLAFLNDSRAVLLAPTTATSSLLKLPHADGYLIPPIIRNNWTTTRRRNFSGGPKANKRKVQSSPTKTNNSKKKFNKNKNKKKTQSPSRSNSSEKSKVQQPRLLSKKLKKQLQKQLDENDRTRPQFIPPALLLPTSSPNVYVSRAAFTDAKENPLEMAKQLFVDEMMHSMQQSKEQDNEFVQNYTPPFFGLTFEYFPPKSFQHELPSSISDNVNDDDNTEVLSGLVPEVAFLGRSNVGKSSLINSLMKKDLAISSKSPGRTQQPFYYGLVQQQQNTNSNNTTSATNSTKKSLGYIVDLPGYGYAKAPETHVEKWQEQTQNFLQNRRDSGSLQRLFLLIDARRGMTRENVDQKTALDLAVMRWCDLETIPYTVVVTKSDCVHKPQLIKVANEACTRYQQQYQNEYEQQREGIDDDDADDDPEPAGYMSPMVHLTSARKGDGIEELRSAVEAEFFATT